VLVLAWPSSDMLSGCCEGIVSCPGNGWIADNADACAGAEAEAEAGACAAPAAEGMEEPGAKRPSCLFNARFSMESERQRLSDCISSLKYLLQSWQGASDSRVGC
jgi:hypothetical protein